MFRVIKLLTYILKIKISKKFIYELNVKIFFIYLNYTIVRVK